MEGKSTFYIQSIDRALNIINTVAESGHEGIRLALIAEKLQLNIATCYRIIKNLMEAEYISVKTDNAYILGPAFVRLGEMAGAENNLRIYCRPILEEAAAASGQTVYLAKMETKEHTIYYVDKVPHKGAIQLSSGIGQHNHVHSTANGKILMSVYTDDVIEAILQRTGMPQQTMKTITDPKAYLEEIHRVRTLGYAVDLEENEANVVCVAAPIYNAGNKVIASISLSGIVGITMNGNIEHNIELIKEYAGKLSRELGHRN